MHIIFMYVSVSVCYAVLSQSIYMAFEIAIIVPIPWKFFLFIRDVSLYDEKCESESKEQKNRKRKRA